MGSYKSEDAKVDYLITNIINRFNAAGILISSLDLSSENGYITGWKGGFHTYKLPTIENLTRKDIDKIIERGVAEFDHPNPALEASEMTKNRNKLIVSLVNRIHDEKWMSVYLCAWCQDHMCNQCKHLDWLDIVLIRYYGRKKSYAELCFSSPVPTYEIAVNLADRIINQIRDLNEAFGGS